MTYDPAEFERVEALIREANVQFINLQFSDIVGIVKQVTIPARQWPQAVQHGIWFDGSSVEGFARIAESDMFLKPDLSTFAVIPWERENLVTARVICDVYTPQGEPFQGDPRHVLKRALAAAEELGYVYNTGPELEFFLFRRDENGLPRPKPHDHAGYFDVSTDLAHDVRRQMVEALQALGIAVEASHHEVAIGQHEIDFHYGPALQAADNAVTFRIVLKAIAQRNGLFASFMPKPIAGINGSGMHTHQSLMRVDTGENAFYDGDDAYGLSQLARQFIAGQLAHARGMAAVIAPLVNSYKRLVPGYEAPVYISWARINRSALIRVPQISPGCPEATRLELRCPDPSCNPYLAFAVMLHAGLDGIRRGLVPPDPAEEDLYHVDEAGRSALATLPGSLGEALEELKRDEVVQAALGPHVYHRYLLAKTQEWDEYRLSVSQWELDRYLPIY
ncbi:MAG: glutamine synthetase family protein [Anaerolineae bacterium]|nr:glutamine synthetase family protein [Anaerolineae bacterium]